MKGATVCRKFSHTWMICWASHPWHEYANTVLSFARRKEGRNKAGHTCEAADMCSQIWILQHICVASAAAPVLSHL